MSNIQTQDYNTRNKVENNIVYEKVENAVKKAQALPFPSRESILGRDPSVQKFWSENSNLLVNAWEQWEAQNKDTFIFSTDELLDTKLQKVIHQAWKNPSLEIEVEKLLVEVSPGVFQFQLFNPQKLPKLRQYLNTVFNAQIPLRPPYGIALNRRGAMLDTRSTGYLATPKFQSFYKQIIDTYMRPIARLLFPEITGYDAQTFGFSIERQADMDTSLRLHTDSSSVTMNVNLNLEHETYQGSEVDFYDPHSGKMNRLSFTPGVALIHRGHVVHAAQPITEGKRNNFVFWLYGKNMSTPGTQINNTSIDAKTRWIIPQEPSDYSAPF